MRSGELFFRTNFELPEKANRMLELVVLDHTPEDFKTLWMQMGNTSNDLYVNQAYLDPR